MARIPYVDPDDANVEPWVHEVVRAMGQGDGAPNVMRAVANHPGALRLVATAADAFYAQGLLPPDRRELAYIAASHTNACHY
jgi:alkylhydroperoxidase family enzyme